MFHNELKHEYYVFYFVGIHSYQGQIHDRRIYCSDDNQYSFHPFGATYPNVQVLLEAYRSTMHNFLRNPIPVLDEVQKRNCYNFYDYLLLAIGITQAEGAENRGPSQS